jgi:tetratricopeptide (TPR) repeat protein
MVDVWSDLYGGLYADARRKLVTLDATARVRGESGAIGDERAANRLFAWARISENEGKDPRYEVVKRYEAAIAAFERAKSISADFSAARASYATSLVNANQLDRAAAEYTDAIAAFERAAAKNPKETNIGDLVMMHRGRGKVHASLKRPVDAERDLTRALELVGQSAGADHILTKNVMAELALFLHREERRSEAWKLFARIDASSPTVIIGIEGMELIQQTRARMLAREAKFDASLDALDVAIAGWRKAQNNPNELSSAEQLRIRIAGMRDERKAQSPNR